MTSTGHRRLAQSCREILRGPEAAEVLPWKSPGKPWENMWQLGKTWENHGNTLEKHWKKTNGNTWKDLGKALDIDGIFYGEIIPWRANIDSFWAAGCCSLYFLTRSLRYDYCEHISQHEPSPSKALNEENFMRTIKQMWVLYPSVNVYI